MPRRLLFLAISLAVLVSLTPTQPTNSQLSAAVHQAIRAFILKARQGEVRVTLPADIAAGDTISGTVSIQPQGQTDTERGKNATELNGLVIEVNDRRWPVSGGKINRLAIPATLSRPAEIILLDGKGKKLDSATLPLNSRSNSATPRTFSFPLLAQSGQPLPITGPFDGDASNTKIAVGNADTKVIAESPRSAVIEVPNTLVGPSNIKVTEKGNSASGSFRALKIDLTAPKTSLTRGESTELHVQVQGLEGITQPVPIQIQNQTPQNINITGGNTQNIVIQPSQVTTGGTFNWTTPITGTSTGGFNITGSLPSADSARPSPTDLRHPIQ